MTTGQQLADTMPPSGVGLVVDLMAANAANAAAVSNALDANQRAYARDLEDTIRRARVRIAAYFETGRIYYLDRAEEILASAYLRGDHE